MIVLKFHEFEDYHFFLKFFLISFNRFLIFPVFRITKVIVKMKKEYQVTESELFDFFNGKLSVEEEKEILEWKEACDENRELFDVMRKENLILKEVVRAQLIKRSEEHTSELQSPS